MDENNVLKIINELPNKIKLIAVSKTKSIEEMMKVYDLGIRDFGENKVQELCDKYDKMPKDTIFHMIGHLQTNKVKYIIGKVDLIHSVDSIKLAYVINDLSIKNNIISNILIQVNITNENTKYGIKKEEVIEFIKEVSLLDNVHVNGLMCVGSASEDNQKYFKEMKDLFDKIKSLKIKNTSMKILSMGMSNDFKLAVKEGSNCVRLGTCIFGKRNYGVEVQI